MERRRALRRTPADDEPVSRMRLRAGRELTVVDLSDSGALIEGATRLLPGTHVDVHVVTKDGRTLVRSRVVRAFVCHVQADVVRYRGAVAFERAIDTSAAGYAMPDILAAAPVAEGEDGAILKSRHDPPRPSLSGPTLTRVVAANSRV